MRINGLAHIGLFTKDIQKSQAFYEMLGGRCYTKGEVLKPNGVTQLAMIRLGDFNLELIQPGDGVIPEGVEGIWPHIALEVERIEEVVEELKEAGVDTFCTETINHNPNLFGGIKNIFFFGPNGEKIELLEQV